MAETLVEKLTVVKTVADGAFHIKRLSPKGRGKGVIEQQAFPSMKAAMEAIRRRKK